MISVVVLHANGRPAALVRTLTSLVGFAIRGLVGDVAVAGADDGVRHIADEAGCALFETRDEAEGLDAALAVARQRDIFVLRSGHGPEPGFQEEVDDLLAAGFSASVMRRLPARFIERLWPQAAPPAGLLAHGLRDLHRPGEDFGHLVRRLKPPTMRSRARPLV